MRHFCRPLVIGLLLCMILVGNVVSAQALEYTGLLNNEATFETLTEVRVSAPRDVATYYGNEDANWVSHPLLDDYPCDTAYVYRSNNMFGGRTAWRNNTNFIVFVEEHFADKESAKAWLDTTGLIPIIEEAKGSILIITPGNGETFTEKDAELYYNIETAQGAAGVLKEVDGVKCTFAEGEYFGGFSYRFAFAVDGGATYFNNYIATNEEYMGRFAGVALIGGQMNEDSYLPNLLPAYLQKTGEDVVAKYVRGNIAGFDTKYAKGTYYVSPVNEAAQVKVEKDTAKPMSEFFTEAYYDMFRNIQRQPVGLKALLTADKPYSDYVVDQSPYSLSKRTWFVGETPSTADAVGVTDGGIEVQGFYGQTLFADAPDSKGQYIDTWFEYVPQEITDAEEGTMPLVVVLHGNDDDMRVVVHQAGWIDVAETDRVAIIAPDHQGHAGQDEKADNIVKLVEYFCEKYPAIDRSRIYVTGFSMGGGATSSVAAWRPEIFAAAAPMAMLATTSAVEGSEERVAAINAAYDIPICFYMSTGDNYVMTTDFYNGELKEKWPPIINDMLAIDELPAIEFDFAINAPFGFVGDESETYVINNEYDGGREIFYKDDVPMFIVNYSREIIHALWAPQAWQVWGELKQYSRDLETKAVIWTPAE